MIFLHLGKIKISKNQMKINNLFKDEFVVVKKVLECEAPENTELQLINFSSEDYKRVTATLNKSYGHKDFSIYFSTYILN